MFSRRQLLKHLPSSPLLGALVGSSAMGLHEAVAKSPAGFRDFYKELLRRLTLRKKIEKKLDLQHRRCGTPSRENRS